MPRESAPKKENHKLGLQDLKRVIEEKQKTTSPQKSTRSVEEMATDLVSASVQNENVKDWVEKEERSAAATRKKWMEDNDPTNYVRFDGKNIRHKKDIPYEEYVHNYNRKITGTLPTKKQEQATISHEKQAEEVREKTRTIETEITHERDIASELGHHTEEFKQLEQEAQKKFHRMKSYENRKGHPEYDVVKQHWEEARDEVVQYEKNYLNSLKGKEVPLRELTTEEKGEKFRSVGALQSKEIEREEEITLPEAEEQAKKFHDEYKYLLRVGEDQKSIDKAKQKWMDSRQVVMTLDNSLPKEKKEQTDKKNPSDILGAPSVPKESAKDAYEKASKEYESLRTKNTEFITNSMLMRAKRKRDTAERAMKGETVKEDNKDTENKTDKKKKSAVVAPVSKPKGFKEWFKINKTRAAALGAGLMAAFLVNNEPKNAGEKVTLPESSPTEVKAETPKEVNELVENKKQEEKQEQEQKKEDEFISEGIQKSDGYTQIWKRALDANPDFMKKAGISDTSPESMKKIGERIKVIDQKTGEEIRLDASTIGGVLKLGINKDGDLLMFSNFDKNDSMETSILRHEGSDYELRQVPGEYRTTKEGTRLADDTTADPFGVFK